MLTINTIENAIIAELRKLYRIPVDNVTGFVIGDTITGDTSTHTGVIIAIDGLFLVVKTSDPVILGETVTGSLGGSAVVGPTSPMKSLKKVSPIGEYLSMEAKELQFLTPCAFPMYASGRYELVGPGFLQYRHMTFDIVVVVRSYVSQEKALHGTTTKMGMYQGLEDVRLALIGQSLGLAISELVPTEEVAIDGDEFVAVFGISLTTRTRG